VGSRVEAPGDRDIATEHGVAHILVDHLDRVRELEHPRAVASACGPEVPSHHDHAAEGETRKRTSPSTMAAAIPPRTKSAVVEIVN
jgi:hypothetical protein